MELDDLKARWLKESNSALHGKNVEQIRSILATQTANRLLDIKKRYGRLISLVLLGIFSQILLFPLLPWIMGDSDSVYAIPITAGKLLPLLTVVLVLVTAVCFYWIKYISSRTFITDDNLENVLSESIKTLKKSLRQEIYFFVLLFVIFLIAGRSGSQFLGNGDFGDIFKMDILLAFLVMAVIMGFYLSRRIRQYKKDLSELETYLSEFDESQNL